MSMKSQRPDRRGWDKVAYEKHVDRLNNMKSSIDLKPPKKIILPNRAEADRRRQSGLIERNNQALLDRLEKLAQKPVIQDDQTDKDLDHKRNFHAHMVQLRRQREARRITEANLLMLERITDATPVYNHAKWEAEALYNDERLKHILSYPEIYEQRVEASRSRQETRGANYLARSSSPVRASTALAYSSSAHGLALSSNPNQRQGSAPNRTHSFLHQGSASAR